MKLPVAFENKMKGLLKDEYEAYLASYDLPKYQGFRINTLKISLEEWEKINPFKEVKPVPWCHDGFYYSQMRNQGNILTIMQDYIIFKNQVPCHQGIYAN